MPPVSKINTSTYAETPCSPRKATGLAGKTAPRMGVSADTSGREDSSKTPDNNNAEIENMEEPSHTGGNNVDPTTGASGGYPQVIPPHETPHQQQYYYGNSQVTPDSPSPNSNNVVRQTYNGGSFFQQPAGGFQNSPFTNDAAHPYAGAPSSQPPSSPTQSMGGIPPASPLFPRMTGPMQAYLNTPRGGDVGVNQGMSPVPSTYPSSSGMYMQGSYPIVTNRHNGSSSNNNSNSMNGNNGNEEFMAWGDNRNAAYSLSPGQGGMPYVPGMPPRPDRSASFDEPVLPHSTSDGSQSAYGGGPGAGPQGWGYGVHDAFGNNSNVSQGRPSGPYPGQPTGGPHYRQPSQYGAPYGAHFGYPTSSPGPPIQTTASNKGPDGANLFIFHIPNHFTNLDMYQLFCPYGNLLSVRIMVEKDSGRSRGFGFVSYDNPDAAALAIKELNGFAIGNKRLKVQHKQIRPTEQQNQEMNHGVHAGGGHPQHHGSGRGRGGRGAFSGRGGGNNLPPSGPVNMGSSGWYNNNDLTSPPASPSATTGDVASADNQNVVVLLGDGPSNSANVSTVESVNTPAAVAAPEEQSQVMDPLASMDPLRNALPDMGGVAAPAVPGEN